MHPAIADFPSKEFYKGNVGNGKINDEILKIPSQIPWPNSEIPVVFVDIEVWISALIWA